MVQALQIILFEKVALEGVVCLFHTLQLREGGGARQSHNGTCLDMRAIANPLLLVWELSDCDGLEKQMIVQRDEHL